MTVENIETLVIGGGQAGVAMSDHLGRQGVPHLVVERHRIAERWRTERWDSLVANGPACPPPMTSVSMFSTVMAESFRFLATGTKEPGHYRPSTQVAGSEKHVSFSALIRQRLSCRQA